VGVLHAHLHAMSLHELFSVWMMLPTRPTLPLERGLRTVIGHAKSRRRT